MLVPPVLLRTHRSAEGELVAALMRISPGNLRALYLPRLSDSLITISSMAIPAPGREWTNSHTVQGRITPKGRGAVVSYVSADGHYAQTPNRTDLSFPLSPLSIAVFADVTNTAADRTFVAKYDIGGTAREYAFIVNGAGDTLQLNLYDETADKQPLRTSNAAITQGAFHTFHCSYDGSGGTLAMDGAVLFQDGAVIASTAFQQALYVQMRDTAATVRVGALSSGQAGFDGSIGCEAVWGANLSDSQQRLFTVACNRYFGTNL